MLTSNSITSLSLCCWMHWRCSMQNSKRVSFAFDIYIQTQNTNTYLPDENSIRARVPPPHPRLIENFERLVCAMRAMCFKCWELVVGLDANVSCLRPAPQLKQTSHPIACTLFNRIIIHLIVLSDWKYHIRARTDISCTYLIKQLNVDSATARSSEHDWQLFRLAAYIFIIPCGHDDWQH